LPGNCGILQTGGTAAGGRLKKRKKDRSDETGKAHRGEEGREKKINEVRAMYTGGNKQWKDLEQKDGRKKQSKIKKG